MKVGRNNAILTVMTREDILKLKAAALYVIGKRGAIDFIHLFKILYFAERKQYAEYGQHLVTDSFCALQNGPVPSFLYDAAKAVTGRAYSNHEGLELLTSVLEPAGGECDYILHAKEDADMDYLSEAEVEALDWSFDENIDKKFDVLSDSSHDVAWHSAWEKGANSEMSSLLIAKAGGASEEFLHYIGENERLDSYIRG